MLAGRVEQASETDFVVDGSPDDSRERLLNTLQGTGFPRSGRPLAQLRLLCRDPHRHESRPRCAGIAVMAADLQEPPELVVEFLRRLGRRDVDMVAVSAQARRCGDASSSLYWRLYRRFVLEEFPHGRCRCLCVAPLECGTSCFHSSPHTSLVQSCSGSNFGSSGPIRRRPSQAERLDPASKASLPDRHVFAFSDLPVRVLWFRRAPRPGPGSSSSAVSVAPAAGTITVPGTRQPSSRLSSSVAST